MTNQEAIALLDALSGDDPEDAHYKADECLRDYLRDNGGADIVDAYNRVTVRAHCFWYA